MSNTSIPVRTISLAIVIAIGLYLGMIALADWNTFSTATSRFPYTLWTNVILLSLLSYLIRFARWHYFITALGHNIPVVSSINIYLSGFALTLTPGKAGETIRSVYLHGYNVSYQHSIAAFVSERLLDLLAVMIMSSLVIDRFPEHQLWLFSAIVCIGTVALLFRSHLMSLILKRLIRDADNGFFPKMLTTARFLMSGRRLTAASLLSITAWSAQGISLYLIVRALGHDLQISTVIGIYCISILAGAASFIPGGLGATEAVIAMLLSTAGVNHTEAIFSSLISRSLTLWLAIVLGIVAMLKMAMTEESHPDKRRNSL